MLLEYGSLFGFNSVGFFNNYVNSLGGLISGAILSVLAIVLALFVPASTLVTYAGYIEDTGVEKFYRDAMGLSILFQRSHHDSMRLLKEIFGEKSGYL